MGASSRHALQVSLAQFVASHQLLASSAAKRSPYS